MAIWGGLLARIDALVCISLGKKEAVELNVEF
jgi:hypothetical protein